MVHEFQIDALSKNWIADLQGDPEARRLAAEWTAEAKAGAARDAAAEGRYRSRPSFVRRAWRTVTS
jgi:hypothetical protein